MFILHDVYIFLALIYVAVGVAPRTAIVVQAVVDSITTLLVMGVAFKLLGATKRARPAAWLAGAVYAIYRTAWHYCLELFVESLLAFSLALFFFVALTPSSWQAVWLGLICGVQLAHQAKRHRAALDRNCHSVGERRAIVRTV